VEMVNQRKVFSILAGSSVVASDVLLAAEKEAREKRADLAQFLATKNILSESLIYETLATAMKIPFIELSDRKIRRDILTIVPEPIAQLHQLIPFEKTATALKIATLDPEDIEVFDFIEKKAGLPVTIYLTTPSSIKNGIKQYHQGLKAEFREIAAEQTGETAKAEDLKQLAEDVPVVRIVDTLLEHAIFENASDIHIEPTEKDTVVRYRIDGVLRDVMTLPKQIQTGVVARIKILANLKIDEHRLPQDGRFKIESEGQRVAFRVSILPVYDGEKVVLRVLNESAQVLTLEQLGLQPGPLEILKRNIAKPHGIILVTGPTGSGKTTTLYTIVTILNTPQVNISTTEDPIEYRMPRVNQTQVNPRIGLTFAAGLRSLLRQDPNIIMVGEIRDSETAEIATHAAMTGHLVLTTLHTNDAVTTLPRLTEMGVPNFLVASTANLVVAQRLVRKICTRCIESYTLSATSIEHIQKQIDLPNVLEILQQEGAIVSAKQAPESLLFYRGRGCRYCNDTGYKGRIGIYETLEVTTQISELILRNATVEQLRSGARAQGMLTMMHDGFLKAKAGITSIEEILRVTKE
ncbi:MAG: type II/IV secretion system protein, partial [Candidatus Kerfeldbacteria bacterium]|nr:type II/IV secretion system protein [Candidatus Kerfeldbacteria bacterium]